MKKTHTTLSLQNQISRIVFIACLSFLMITANQTSAQWNLAGNNLVSTDRLGSLNSFDVKIITNGNTRMTIKKNSGNVGIGTTSPAAKLEVAGGDAKINSITVGLGGSAIATNVAIGSSALFGNTVGYDNTATGNAALFTNSYGWENTANGSLALNKNTGGDNNTAIGFSTLRENTIGSGNTAIGGGVLRLNTVGSFNTSTGSYAMYYNTSGANNTAIGSYGLFSNTTGSVNLASGSSSLYYNTSGSYNTASGVLALFSNTTASNNVANGYQSLYSNTTGANNTASGYQSLYSSTSASENTANGYQALYSGNGTLNTASGSQALYSNNNNWNSAFGAYTLKANTLGGENTGIGYSALRYNTTGYSNSATGSLSLLLNTSGSGNTASGSYALYSNTSGNNNTAAGYYAFSTGATLSNATALGFNAIPTASNQVYLGDASVTGVYCFSGLYTASDSRFKNTVEENVPGLDFITKLRPVTYHYDMDNIAEFLRTPDTLRLKESEAKKSSMLYTGFIAQEVEKSANEIGYEFSGVSKPKNAADYYAINYAEFVVPLVKSVQELSKQNEDLKSQLATMQAQIDALMQDTKLPVDVKSKASSFSTPILDQIAPNPFSQRATIRFSLPANATDAQLLISDLSGKVLKSYTISASSTQQVINGNEFSAGTYQYSISISGKIIDSRQMVVVK